MGKNNITRDYFQGKNYTPFHSELGTTVFPCVIKEAEVYTVFIITSSSMPPVFMWGPGRGMGVDMYIPPNSPPGLSHSCGRYKYARKVDYLIDDLIRKSRRTFCHSHLDEREIKIPNSIGPQPTPFPCITSPLLLPRL